MNIENMYVLCVRAKEREREPNTLPANYCSPVESLQTGFSSDEPCLTLRGQP